MDDVTDRELLRLHLEAVWGISLPPLAGASIELPASEALPPWLVYLARLEYEQVILWHPNAEKEQRRATLLQQARDAGVVSNPSLGMRREVVLRQSASPGTPQPSAHAVVRPLAADDAPLLERFEAESAGYFLAPEHAPCIGVIVGGRLVTVAHSSRRTPDACELGINTLPEARRQGYATRATVAWTAAILDESLLPIYSAFAHNAASLRVAASAGYRRVAEGTYGPVREDQE